MRAVALNRITMVLAFAGIFVAGAVSLSHIMRKDLPCGAGGGCADVIQHPSGMWFGQPVGYYGLAAYFALALLSGLRASNGMHGVRKATLAGLAISAIGTALSAYLTYQALVVIGATCYWCLSSAAIMTALFVVHAMLASTPEPADEGTGDFDFKLMVGLGLLSAIAIIGSTALLQNKQQYIVQSKLDKLTEEELVPEGAHILGDPNAPITIVEFADFFCAQCKSSFAPVHDLMKRSSGKIRLVFRHLPLYQMQGHEHSGKAAIIAEAAGQEGKFWHFVEGVFSGEEAPTIDYVYDVAASLGLDRAALDKRLGEGDPAIVDPVKRDVTIANKFMSDPGTPTFVVFKTGGRRFVAHSYDQLDGVLKITHFQEILGSRQ